MGRLLSERAWRSGLLLAVGIALATAIKPPASSASHEGRNDRPMRSLQTELHADLDGQPIDLVDVGKWYCHDFDFPAIHCYSNPDALADAPTLAKSGTSALRSTDSSLAAAGVTYATVYEFTFYQGAFMHMAQDYSMLSLIGWNDRISSFVVKNGESGVFWTNWLYSGTRFTFCCNSAFGSLGSFNDTFSSVFRN